MARAEYVSVTALETLAYQGRLIAKDETFDVLPVEALSLTYLHKAKFSKPLPRHRPATKEIEKPKRQYRRRDMQAEE